ncbi:MAG: site-specific integrase, partial [Xanthobacteraceae bacterium]
DFTDGNGKRHIRTFPIKKGSPGSPKKMADAYEASVAVAVNTGTHVALDGQTTIADAAEKWIKRVEANGMRNDGPAERATVRQYREHIDLHIVPRVGKLKLVKLTKKDVEHFRDAVLKKGDGKDAPKPLSRAMAIKVLTSFKSLLKVAGVGHHAADVTLGNKKRDQHKLAIGHDIPTPAEIKRLIDASKDNLKKNAMLRTLAFTGLRASELRGLRWRDIDLTNNELHVRQRADRYNDIGNPKTKESARTVPFGLLLSVVLKKWKLACPKGELDLVFPTSTGAVDYHKNVDRSLAPVIEGGEHREGRRRAQIHRPSPLPALLRVMVHQS